MAKCLESKNKYSDYLQNGQEKRHEGKYKEAMEYFVKALPFSKDGEAEFEIGCLYYHGQGTDASYDEAIKWMFKAARKRHTEAMLNVGCWYNGDKSEPHVNYKRAAQWFYRATMAGNDLAAYHLGLLYRMGKGVDADAIKGEYLYLLAAGRKYRGIFILLGSLYKEAYIKSERELDYCRAEYWFKRAIAQDDEEEYVDYAKEELAELYEEHSKDKKG